jgi:hypothetical protein
MWEACKQCKLAVAMLSHEAMKPDTEGGRLLPNFNSFVRPFQRCEREDCVFLDYAASSDHSSSFQASVASGSLKSL